MERHTPSRPTTLCDLVIRELDTNIVKRKTYRLTPDKFEHFAKMIGKKQGKYELVNIIELE